MSSTREEAKAAARALIISVQGEPPHPSYWTTIDEAIDAAGDQWALLVRELLAAAEMDHLKHWGRVDHNCARARCVIWRAKEALGEVAS